MHILLCLPKALRTIHTSDYSYPGLFVLWVDYSYLGRFVRWTFRTTDYSYYGLFVPYVKYSHINCWCEKALTLQAVYQMQLDLGARLVICICAAVACWLFFSYNSYTNFFLLFIISYFFSFRILYAGRWAGLHVLLTKSFDEISNTSWRL